MTPLLLLALRAPAPAAASTPTNHWVADPAHSAEGAQLVGDDVRITIDIEATER